MSHIKKLRCIKEYPSSPNIGTEYEYDLRDANALMVYNQKNSYPEFWEQVKEPTFEILRFKTTEGGDVNRKLNNGLFAFTTDLNFKGGLTEEFLLSIVPKCYVIHTVKRLSDGFILSLGDDFVTHKNTIGNVKELRISEDGLRIVVRYQTGQMNLENVKSAKPTPLENTFKTRLEDEQRQLLEKIENLESYIKGEAFRKLTPANRLLLRKQLRAMEEYFGILLVRLELLTKENNR